MRIAADAVLAAYFMADDAAEAVQRLIHMAAIQHDLFLARPLIVALGQMGPAAKQAKPFLIGQLRSACTLDEVRVVRQALALIDPR